jgi:hypothetical protein
MRRMRLGLVLAAASWLGVLTEARVSAVSGACKERASYNGAWGRNGMTLEQCKAYNQRKDGDDVFAERGLVWWDVRA